MKGYWGDLINQLEHAFEDEDKKAILMQVALDAVHDSDLARECGTFLDAYYTKQAEEAYQESIREPDPAFEALAKMIANKHQNGTKPKEKVESKYAQDVSNFPRLAQNGETKP